MLKSILIAGVVAMSMLMSGCYNDTPGGNVTPAPSSSVTPAPSSSSGATPVPNPSNN
jgi:hypothetical protein